MHVRVLEGGELVRLGRFADARAWLEWAWARLALVSARGGRRMGACCGREWGHWRQCCGCESRDQAALEPAMKQREAARRLP